ncbi:MAG TPA: hypothetical protein DCQ06_03160, partial [Myxococcales bacterium]|nr:hypothetical protein [Myxococcales bacterium]
MARNDDELRDMFAPVPGPLSPDPEFEAMERAFQLEARRRIQRWVVGSIAIFTLLFVWSHADRLYRHTRRAYYSWQALSSDSPLAGVDLARVHGELLTNWVVARNDDPIEAEAAKETMLEALDSSPPLTQLFETLHELSAPDEGLWERHDLLLDTIEAWNNILRRSEAPWWLDSNVMVGQGQTQFYVKTYHVQGTMVLKVGQQRVVTRLLARADSLNVLEFAMGHASPERDHASVLLHRIEDHATDVVWPALASTVTEDDSSLRSYVRREIKTALSPAQWQALSSTSEARKVLKDIVMRVDQRRKCGARLVLRIKTLDGFAMETIRWLRGVAARESQFECPAISLREVHELDKASRVLRRASGVREAIDTMLVWLARGVAIHEARHIADQRQSRGLERKMDCEHCPESFGVRTRAELSAWVAELSWVPSPFATLLHACSLPKRTTSG